MAARFIILGGGISGLAAAWRLVERGVEVDLLEAAPAVGGLAGTQVEGDFFLDIGPHSFFSDDAQIEKAVLALFTRRPAARSRTVKLFYQGRYIDYPLTAKAALLQMGLASGIQAAASYAREKLRPRRLPAADSEESVRDWAIRSFGEHLYQSFFKPYTEQFWLISCEELSATAIPEQTRLSFAAALRLLLRRKAGRGGTSLIEREMLPTYSPERGFFEIAEGIAAKVSARGGRVHRGCRATAVELRRGNGVRVEYQSAGMEREIAGDHVISTVPLPLLIGILRPHPPAEARAAADRLEYRSLVVLGMLTRKERVLGCSYLYQLDRPYNRLFEMKSFSARSSPPGFNIVGAEIPCLRGSDLWSSTKEELFERCAGNLAADGFLTPGDVERLLLARASHAYPIYRKGYADHLRRVRDYLDALGCLTTLGRSGEFRYMDIDQCLRRAFDLVDERLAAGVALPG